MLQDVSLVSLMLTSIDSTLNSLVMQVKMMRIMREESARNREQVSTYLTSPTSWSISVPGFFPFVSGLVNAFFLFL